MDWLMPTIGAEGLQAGPQLARQMVQTFRYLYAHHLSLLPRQQRPRCGPQYFSPLRVDYLGGVLDNWLLFTVDHPTKAGAIAWLVLLLVFVVVAPWVLNYDRGLLGHSRLR